MELNLECPWAQKLDRTKDKRLECPKAIKLVQQMDCQMDIKWEFPMDIQLEPTSAVK